MLQFCYLPSFLWVTLPFCPQPEGIQTPLIQFYCTVDWSVLMLHVANVIALTLFQPFMFAQLLMLLFSYIGFYNIFGGAFVFNIFGGAFVYLMQSFTAFLEKKTVATVQVNFLKKISEAVHFLVKWQARSLSI